MGEKALIAIETHGFLNRPTAVGMARRLSKLNFNCIWCEEPAPPEYPEAIADIRTRIPLPVCVGERLHNRFMVRAILENHAGDIIMPIVTRCGGISEPRKIDNLAEAFNVPIAPHNPNGPRPTIAAAHVMATVPSFFRQDYIAIDMPWRDACLSHPLPINDGCFVLSERLGLGFDVKEEELARHPGLPIRPRDRTFCV